ncbi:hypothetical protein [Spodoptera cosmioides nucleopolyhedrovirus]|uniref:Uncharacterized protein n=1 Tax=Spodoptera cosmioides nucleopolyhedrovirus TaxID=2605774 RepID=A0A6B7KTF1_9ABAC|nr:hypothetical protein [Spodoptera cosmioides nucleopolyhedrovirus]
MDTEKHETSDEFRKDEMVHLQINVGVEIKTLCIILKYFLFNKRQRQSMCFRRNKGNKSLPLSFRR